MTCGGQELAVLLQASDKRKVQLPEWKRKLDAVKIRKEDMNKLIMNFLVTEVRPVRTAGQQ